MASNKFGCAGILAAVGIGVPIILCCGIVSLAPTPNDSSNRRSISHSSRATTSPASSPTDASNPAKPATEAERIFAKRLAAYERELADWERAVREREHAEATKAKLLNALEDHQADEPQPPRHEERTWSTVDKKYKTDATLVETDNIKASLKRADGKVVTVPKAQLIAEDRIYLETAFADAEAYQGSMSDWKSSLDELNSQMALLEKRLATAASEKPAKPKLSDVVSELATAERKAAEQRRAADAAAKRSAEEAARQRAQDRLDAYAAVLRTADPEGLLIHQVKAKGSELELTVTNTWHLMHYQNRLQAAQNLWQGWANIESPRDPDKARLSLVDLNGNDVGGSRFLAGSLIWVQED